MNNNINPILEDASTESADAYMVAPGDSRSSRVTRAQARALHVDEVDPPVEPTEATSFTSSSDDTYYPTDSVDNDPWRSPNPHSVSGRTGHPPGFNRINLSLPMFTNSNQTADGKPKLFSQMQNDAKNWLHKAENFCDYNEVYARKRVLIVSTRLDAAAYDWYYTLSLEPDFNSADWKQFKVKFTEAFCPISHETQYVDDFRILALKQKVGQPVAGYVGEFLALRKSLPHKEANRFCVSRFLFGLTDELRGYVLGFKPATIENAAKLAQEGEEMQRSNRRYKTLEPMAQVYYNGPPNQWKNSRYKPKRNFKRGYKPYKKYNKPYKSFNNFKPVSSYSSLSPLPVTINTLDVNQMDVDEPSHIVGHVLKMDLMPSQVRLKLCPAIINGVHSRELLVDTGSTTDVVAYNVLNQLGCVDKIIRFKETKQAAIIKDYVNVLGYIPLKIQIQIGSKKIENIRSFYVLDSNQDLFILGLPFIKEHEETLTLADLVNADHDVYTTFKDDSIEVNIFEYNEREVNNMLKLKENTYFFGQIYQLDTNLDDEKTIDVEIDNAEVNRYRNTIFKNYAEVVTEDSPTELPTEKRCKHRIILSEPKKIAGRNQYPLSFSEKKELTKQVEKLLGQGFIRESSSPFNSPVLFVRKKDATMRMCIDFRLLNNNTIKDKFPLPRIDQLISRFGTAQVYSKLDLMSGYYQVRIADEDIEKTAFSTDYGHYEWVVMPFGLTNAPATFQRMMNTVLKDFLNKFVQVYLDDIFIYSESYEQHFEHIKMVLDVLRKSKLIAKKSKCAFFFEELRFLGHVISPQGIRTDPEKIIKVKNWPTPKNIKEAQMFLGLTSYYRRFIKDHSKIANPIHKFITKDAQWQDKQDEAFQTLKDALIKSPTLVHPDWSDGCTFIVHTDACGTSLGYTLEQLDANGKLRGVLAYGSKKLVGSQLNYGIYDREFLAVVEALKNWRYYLLGKHFIIMTDHKSLIYLKNQNLIDSTRVARWLDYLSQYDFEIQYVAGKLNSAADALSRYPYDEVKVNCFDLMTHKRFESIPMSINAVGTVTTMNINQDLKKQILVAIKKDQYYKDIYQILVQKKQVPVEINHHIKHYEVKEGMLYYKTLLERECTRLVVPNDQKLINKLIKNAHSGVDAGHFGTFKTYTNLCDTFYWKNMLPTIKRFCNTCQVCQRNNTSTQKLQGLFMPLPVPEGRWTDVSMDFITGLPTTESNFDMIMVLVDRFSKMAHFIPTTKTLTAEKCAKLFINFCFRHHGVPRRLVSDKDIRFMNKFWSTIHFLCGTSLLFSTTNHPQTDGQTERVNKILNHLLRKHCSNDMLNWDQYLPIVEFAYNSTYQNSIKNIPFKLGIGYVPDSFKNVLSWKIDDDRYSSNAEDYVRRMLITLEQAQDNIVEAQKLQEKYYNQHRRAHNYKVGDFILLHREANGSNPSYLKIQPVFFGPYRLVKKINDNTFEVDLPSMNKKDRELNVQWFKAYRHQEDLFRQPPRTDLEILARINEMCGIGGIDENNDSFDVFWRDCDPRHATTVSGAQFNTASSSLQTSLLHQARIVLCS